MLRIVDGDWKKTKSFNTLHKQYNRASPEMWSDYCTARTMYNIYTSESLNYVEQSTSINELMNRRRGGPTFMRRNKLKIGLNSRDKEDINQSTV